MAAWNQQPIFGNGYYCTTVEQNNYMEKRQVFLRSYQFCRKRSVGERIRTSFICVKRVICLRLRSVGKFRKLVWYRLRLRLKLRFGFLHHHHMKKGRFHRLSNPGSHHRSASPSSCFFC